MRGKFIAPEPSRSRRLPSNLALIQQLHSELNITGIARGRDDPELGRAKGGSGVSEAGMVQEIKEFSPELKVPALAK